MKIKFSAILKGLTGVLTRFPLAILSAIIATVCIILSIDNWENQNFSQGFMAASLGLPLFTSVQLFIERRNSSVDLRIIFSAICLLLLGGYFYFLRTVDMDNMQYIIQFLILHLVLLCCVAVAAYATSKDVMSFAKFNSSIFLHVLESFVSSLILYAAMALALFALDSLFGVEIDGNVYIKLFIVIAGIFNSIYILSGIKEGFDYSNFDLKNNRLYKILAQYILIPVVIVYTIILYAYSVKVLLVAEETNEWVASMILWFFVAGVLAYLMNYVFRNDEKSFLAKSYLKWFFVISMPLLVLLFYVSIVNVKEAGMTPEFYFAFLLGAWLLGISIYLLISKHDQIKWIPITLIGVGLFSIFSPWSVHRVIVNSQMDRLATELTTVGIIEDGKLVRGSESNTNSKQIRTSVGYLDQFGALTQLKRYDTDNIFPDTIRSQDFYDMFWKGSVSGDQNFIEIPQELTREVDIQGYDVMIKWDINSMGIKDVSDLFSLSIKAPMSLQILKDNQMSNFDLTEFITSYPTTKNRVFIGEDQNMRVKIHFQNAVTEVRNGKHYLNYGTAFILIHEKEI